MVVRLYHRARMVWEEMVRQEGERVRYRVPYKDIDCQTADNADTAVVRSRCDPWELSYTLVLQGETEGRVVGLLDRVSLLPPDSINVTCTEICLLSWCLPRSQLHLQVQ